MAMLARRSLLHFRHQGQRQQPPISPCFELPTALRLRNTCTAWCSTTALDNRGKEDDTCTARGSFPPLPSPPPICKYSDASATTLHGPAAAACMHVAAGQPPLLSAELSLCRLMGVRVSHQTHIRCMCCGWLPVSGPASDRVSFKGLCICSMHACSSANALSLGLSSDVSETHGMPTTNQLGTAGRIEKGRHGAQS